MNETDEFSFVTKSKDHSIIVEVVNDRLSISYDGGCSYDSFRIDPEIAGMICNALEEYFHNGYCQYLKKLGDNL